MILIVLFNDTFLNKKSHKMMKKCNHYQAAVVECYEFLAAVSYEFLKNNSL